MPVRCPWCRLQFKYGGSYRTHLSKKHPKLPIQAEEYATPSGDESDEQSPLNDTCGNENLDIDSDLESLSDQSGIEEGQQGEVETHIYPGAGEVIGDAKELLYDEKRPWFPFHSEYDFKLARWFIRSGTPSGQIDEFFAEGLGGRSSFTSAYKMMQMVDQMDAGLGWASWHKGETDFESADIEVESDEESTRVDGAKLSSYKSTFYYRDIVSCAAYLLAQRCYADNMVFAPIQEQNSEGKRMYSEMHTADWWWETQNEHPAGSTIVPIILSSDETHLTNFSGDKKAWPIYMTIGNINSKTRNSPSMHAIVLIALLPVPPKFSGTRKKDILLRERSQNILREVLELLLAPLGKATKGLKLDCSDGKKRLCFPILSAWIADHKENVTLHNILGNLCPVCEEDESRLGNYQSLPAKPRNYLEYIDLLERYNQGDIEAGDELHDRGVKLTRGVLWNLEFINCIDLPKPDLLHVVYLGIFIHLMSWVMGFLKKHGRKEKFDVIWRSLPPYPGFTAPNKEYSQVSQWQGKEMRRLVRVLLPCLASSLRRPSAREKSVFEKATKCVRNIVDFTLMAQYQSHTIESLEWMESYLKEFHIEKDVFKEFRSAKGTKRGSKALAHQLRTDYDAELKAQGSISTVKRRHLEAEYRLIIQHEVEQYCRDNSDFNFPKIHLLTHFRAHVERFGNLQAFSTESGEASHKEIKSGYGKSNKNDASRQILNHMARVNNFRMFDLNRARDNKSEQELVKDAKRQLGSLTPKRIVRNLRDAAEFCDIPNLSTLVAEYYRKSPKQIEKDEESLLETPLEHYRMIRIPVRSFQDENEWEWHLARCTGEKVWRSTGSPRNDWVWVFTGHEERYGDLRGRIPAHLKCLLKIRDPRQVKSSVRVAIVELLAPERNGQIQEPHGLVRVQRKTNRSLKCVGIKALEGVAHLVPEEPGSGNTKWFVNSRIDLRTFNLIC